MTLLMRLPTVLLLLSASVSAVEAMSADGKSSRNYLDTLPVFWRTVYPDGAVGLYCGESFSAHDRRFNIEHVYPMAWVTRELGCGDRRSCRSKSIKFNEIESDMHNLYPARKDINKARGSYPYREIRGRQTIEAGCDTEIDHQRRVIEPRAPSRGNIARAMLYMADRYDLEIYARQRKTLMAWHHADPVDGEERRRNRVIAGTQGVSNHWIEPDYRP